MGKVVTPPEPHMPGRGMLCVPKQRFVECANICGKDGRPPTINLETQCNSNKNSNTKFYVICQNHFQNLLGRIKAQE